MRRQTEVGGACSVGASSHARLDPFALPVRYTASDAAADGRVRDIEIDRTRIRLRRTVRGMAINVNVPVDSFLGVAMRLVAAADGGEEGVVLSLVHPDPALTLPVFEASDSADAMAEWQNWARALGLPLLVADRAGALHRPFPTLGGVRLGEPGPRRRRRNAIKRRRPAMPLRRRAARMPETPLVHREREIIARN